MDFHRSALTGLACVVLGLASATAQSAPAPGAAPPGSGPAASLLSPADLDAIARIQAAGLADRRAYNLTEALTTELGPRLAGSPQEARARAWAVARLQAEGFADARIEPFKITFWGRISERAEVLGPAAQPLTVAALGGSPSTPKGGLEAEVTRFANLSALEAAAPGSQKGRIVFIDEVTIATQDGMGYGAGVVKRRRCATVAAGKGAVACLIRSAGSSVNRFAHVGMQGPASEPGMIPAASLPNADANQLTRLLARGPVRLRLDLQTTFTPNVDSGNVSAEIRGRTKPQEVILVGCHLDSWDPGSGALDDAVGCGIVTAAARLVQEATGGPARTIRVVWFGSEEVGILGALEYARRHEPELGSIVLASESDGGAGRIFKFDHRFGDSHADKAAAIAAALAPLAILRGDAAAMGGPDMGPLRQKGVPVFDLAQDMTSYFNFHHTPDDTFERIILADVQQNVAAWASVLWLASEKGWTFRETPSASP